MNDQKTLKEIYKTDMTNYWRKRNGEPNQKMIDYCMKKIALIIPLNDNDYYVIDKPEIEKDFCFGYGYCGVSTDEDYQDAAGMAAHAKTSTDYFIDQNMEPLDRRIKDLTDTSYKIYKREYYIKQQKDCKLIDLHWIRGYEEAPKNEELLTPEEITAIIAGYEEVKKAFMKRLNSYLKRYGLTKVRSWTYLSD